MVSKRYFMRVRMNICDLRHLHFKKVPLGILQDAIKISLLNNCKSVYLIHSLTNTPASDLRGCGHLSRLSLLRCQYEQRVLDQVGTRLPFLKQPVNHRPPSVFSFAASCLISFGSFPASHRTFHPPTLDCLLR